MPCVEKGVFKMEIITTFQEEDKRIVKIEIGEYAINVFPGNKGEHKEVDIIVKCEKPTSKNQGAKLTHTQWTMDLLMKLSGNKGMTKKFIRLLLKHWKSCTIIPNRHPETLKSIIEDFLSKIQFEKFDKLNQYGEYSVECLYTFMCLIALEEKANSSNARYYEEILSAMLKDNIDLAYISRRASGTYGG